MKKNTSVRSIWGYETYFSNYNTQSRGVAIFINNNYDCKVISIEKDNSGNFLIVNYIICEKDITLVNIYDPNRDNPQFYDSISEKLSKYDNSFYVLAGEFNLVLNPEEDCYNYSYLNNLNARDKVHSIIINFNLIDVWRKNNILDKREYT